MATGKNYFADEVGTLNLTQTPKKVVLTEMLDTSSRVLKKQKR